MPQNSKETNQYFGKYFENAVCSIINNEPIKNLTGYMFTDEEIEELNADAQQCARYIGGNKAIWVGNKTTTEDCDIIVDNEKIELKHVSAGTGTYFNTSIYYFEKFGFDFKQYMKNYGLYQSIENLGFVPSYKNNSPVNQKVSKTIRHEFTNSYNNIIIPTDEMARKAFVNDLYNYFSNNTDKMMEFVQDMLEKNPNESNKHKPDRLIVYNYDKKTISEITIKCNSGILSKTDKGLKVGMIRFAISWQNGCGLNNPTIRVFLGEETK